MIETVVFIILVLASFISLMTLCILAFIWLIKKCRHLLLNKITRKLKIVSIVFGGLVMAAVCVLLISDWITHTPDIDGENSVFELKEVSLNDNKEWISIRGEDKEKPILLFLAGGPGGSQMAAVRHNLSELEKSFIVVNWDQPGSGKSFNAVKQKDMNINTYINDGIALTEYLCERFGKEKIYLVGESWGSALGIFMASKAPQYYQAVIGTGQMIDFLETENIDYDKAMEIAKSRNDNKKIKKLEKNGRPPYYGSDVTMKSVEYLGYLNDEMARNKEIYNNGYNTIRDILSPEYSILDKIHFFQGMLTTFNHVYPQLYDIDLRTDYNKIEVPVYFFLGRHDINAPTSLVEDYMKVLKSPHKEIVWFEHSGHGPWINESKRFIEELNKISNQYE